MRYRLAALMLFAVLSVMSLLIRPTPAPAILDNESPLKVTDRVAEPDPEPYAILDIGPPPKGTSAKDHRTDVIYHLTNPRGFIWWAWCDREVNKLLKKLLSDARLKSIHPWLEKNIRVVPEDGVRRLRLTFQAGTRAEQATILNGLLRVYFRQLVASHIKIQEEALRCEEKLIVGLEQRIESGMFRDSVDSYRKGINDLRTNRIPDTRAEIARLKQVAVIKWAK